MIKIKITDTTKPTDSGNLFTNAFSSVETAIQSISELSEGQDKPKLVDALLNMDEEFIVHVESSFVEIVQYNFYTKVLTVHLTSGTYEYQEVEAVTFLLFVNSDSKGQFFNRHFKAPKR